MKQSVITLAFAAIVLSVITGCASSPGSDKTATPDTPQKALAASKNSAAFNESVEKLLNSYFSVKKAIIEYDTTAINSAAKTLVTAADSLKTDEIKGDSTGAIKATAKTFAGTISGSAKGLAGETDIIKKKREFQMISDALYDLVRTVKYDRQKLYHQHCPMAFNDNEEAYWISNSNKIENPYMGKKHPKYKAAMMECGDITDSLDFAGH